MKKISKIEFVCPKCNKEPDRDEKQSNENWSVIPNICPDCGGQLKLKTS